MEGNIHSLQVVTNYKLVEGEKIKKGVWLSSDIGLWEYKYDLDLCKKKQQQCRLKRKFWHGQKNNIA